MNEFRDFTGKVTSAAPYYSEDRKGEGFEAVIINFKECDDEGEVKPNAPVYSAQIFASRLESVSGYAVNSDLIRNLAKAIIGGDISFVLLGEQFQYFKGAENVQDAERDLVLFDLKSLFFSKLADKSSFIKVDDTEGVFHRAKAKFLERRLVDPSVKNNGFNPHEDMNEFGSGQGTAKGVKNAPKTAVPAE